MQNGIALSITFFIIGGFLYFIPSYTGFVIISNILTLLFLIIAIFGLSFELNKLGEDNVKLGFDDFVTGLVIGFFWVTIYYFFPVWWVNLITLPLLLLSVYGITIGILKILRNLFFSKNGFFIKLPIVIIQFTAFIAAIVTILNFFE